MKMYNTWTHDIGSGLGHLQMKPQTLVTIAYGIQTIQTLETVAYGIQTVLCGTNNILQNIPHIQSKWWNVLHDI